MRSEAGDSGVDAVAVCKSAFVSALSLSYSKYAVLLPSKAETVDLSIG